MASGMLTAGATCSVTKWETLVSWRSLFRGSLKISSKRYARPRADLRATPNDAAAHDHFIDYPLGQRFNVDLAGVHDTQTLHFGKEGHGEIRRQMHSIGTACTAADDRLQPHRRRRQSRGNEHRMEFDAHPRVVAVQAQRLNDPLAPPV